jgi:hypothetical protein
VARVAYFLGDAQAVSLPRRRFTELIFNQGRERENGPCETRLPALQRLGSSWLVQWLEDSYGDQPGEVALNLTGMSVDSTGDLVCVEPTLAESRDVRQHVVHRVATEESTMRGD